MVRLEAGVYPSFAKEGWTRPKEDGPVPLRSGRGGCFKLPLKFARTCLDNRWLETTTPSAPAKERGHFLDGAATPPSRRRGNRVPQTVSQFGQFCLREGGVYECPNDVPNLDSSACSRRGAASENDTSVPRIFEAHTVVDLQLALTAVPPTFFPATRLFTRGFS